MRPLAYLLLLVLLAACSSKDAAAPAIHPLLAIVAGDGQVDTVGKTLPVQLAAALTDKASGAPLAGRILNWQIVAGDGSVFVAVTQTGTDGIGRNSLTLGHSAIGHKVVAKYIDPDTGEPVTLDTARATALPAVADTMWVSRADTLVGPGGTFGVRYGMIDGFGNATWSCAASKSSAVTWTFSNYITDVVTPVGAPIVVDSVTTQQNFQITGPDNTAIGVAATSSCAPGASITVRYSN